jgi:hypothetical protein
VESIFPSGLGGEDRHITLRIEKRFGGHRC